MGREEIRAPLKMPAWEARIEKEIVNFKMSLTGMRLPLWRASHADILRVLSHNPSPGGRIA